MNLCLSGLPKLRNAVYLTCRIKPIHKPSLSIPLNFLHLFTKALYYDTLLSQHEINELINSLYTLYDWNLSRVNLEVLEVVDYERDKLIKFLRGYFTDGICNCSDQVFTAFIPGLENTCILSIISYINTKFRNFVIDIRDIAVKSEFLKDILTILNNFGEVFLVIDSLYNSLPYNLFDKIYIGPNADIKNLSRIFNDISTLSPKTLLIRKEFLYQLEKSDMDWFSESNGRYVVRWDKPKDLDYISMIFLVNNDVRVVEDIASILMEVYDSGGCHEREIIDKLTDVFGYMAKPILYLLLKYGFLKSVISPTGRSYVLSDRGIEVVLKRYREGRD